MHETSLVSSGVSLADVFPRDAILLGLQVHTKCAAIERMVYHLAELQGLGRDRERLLVQSILARETAGSTGIGNGIAIPHCRSSLVDKCFGVLALDPAGVPFDTLDGEPVYSVFLLVAPLDGIDKPYQVIGKIAAIGMNKSQRIRLQGCRTQETAHHFLCDFDRP